MLGALSPSTVTVALICFMFRVIFLLFLKHEPNPWLLLTGGFKPNILW